MGKPLSIQDAIQKGKIPSLGLPDIDVDINDKSAKKIVEFLLLEGK